VPTGVIINDYVDVTHAFFGAKEPGLVNAVLDKLSKNLRAN
jgi:N utilization substance protein B